METQFEVGKWYKFYWLTGNIYVYGKIQSVYYVSIITSSGVWMNAKPLYRETDGYELKDIKEVQEITDLSEIQQYLPDGHVDKILYERGYNIFGKNTIPEYVEYVTTAYKGIIVKVEDWTPHNYCKVSFGNGNKEQPFKNLVKPSTKEEFDKQNQKWIPQVGEYAVMENAGGYGYWPGNNGCIAIIYNVFQMIDEENYSISGRVINPKSHECTNFYHIPIKDKGRIVCRKALPHEILDNFVLPEKWCIKVNSENQEIVGNWFLTVFDRHKDIDNHKGYLETYYSYPVIKGDRDVIAVSQYTIPNGYTEITLEQFKKYVLKEGITTATGSIIYDGTLTGGKYYLGVDSYEEGEKSSDIQIPKLTIPAKTPVKVVIDSGYPEINIKLKPKKVPVIDKLTIKPINILVK